VSADPLLAPLAAAVPPIRVRQVVVGLNWTLVVAETGCGLAHTPPRGAPGCRALDGAGTLTRRRLDELAGMVADTNPTAAAIGLAAINAAQQPGPALGTGNGLDLFADIADRTVVAGRFPGIAARLPGCKVVERSLGPGEFAEDEAEPLLDSAAALVVTASALLNGGVGRYLALARSRPWIRTALVGPGTPLSPLLFAAGLSVLAGVQVTDARAAARIVAEGGSVQALRPVTRAVMMERRPGLTA